MIPQSYAVLLLYICQIISNICCIFAILSIQTCQHGRHPHPTSCPKRRITRFSSSTSGSRQASKPNCTATMHGNCITSSTGTGPGIAGDTLQPFSAGDVVLIPPGMFHLWIYEPDSADDDGHVRYLMSAFSHSFVERCVELFPELRNRAVGSRLPDRSIEIRGRKFPDYS